MKKGSANNKKQNILDSFGILQNISMENIGENRSQEREKSQSPENSD